MKTQYILYGFAVAFLLISLRHFLRTGTLLAQHKTYLIIAAIFTVVATVLQFSG